MSLDELRQSIDRLDDQIVRLLSERAKVVKKLADVKQRGSQRSYVPEREREIYEKIARLNPGPLGDQALQAIYTEILSGSRALERELHIAFLGPQATFSHQAAKQHFGKSCTYLPEEDIRGVFAIVAKRQADYGVVPIETAAAGAVTDTLDMFMEFDVRVCGEVVVEIHQHLLAKCELPDVRRVYSRAEAFDQCRDWLARHLPEAELVPMTSTAKAAEKASAEPQAAAVASEEAASEYELPVRADSIQDKAHNSTRFFVLSDHIAGRTGKDKTSLMFGIKDEVGALCNILMSIRDQEINLTKIESRPSRRRAWDYFFFLDMEGHLEDEPVKRALDGVRPQCTFFQVLGSYPRG